MHWAVGALRRGLVRVGRGGDGGGVAERADVGGVDGAVDVDGGGLLGLKGGEDGVDGRSKVEGELAGLGPGYGDGGEVGKVVQLQEESERCFGVLGEVGE